MTDGCFQNNKPSNIVMVGYYLELTTYKYAVRLHDALVTNDFDSDLHETNQVNCDSKV